ncbi:MAG: FAD-dependent oxidoreductase [Candidatus Cloacimonetes bacterium]|nr:FAD-dependent oxidoreductase [Candidatus Cloacimonadota bacterium]
MSLKDVLSPFKVWERAARKPWTVKNPIDERKGSANYRGFHKNDLEKCIGCGTCEDICQNLAIDLVPVENVETNMGDSGLRPMIDYGRCCWCALCVDVCPTGSLNMSNEYNWIEEEAEGFRFIPGADKKSWDDSDKGYHQSDDIQLIDPARIVMEELEAEERKSTFVEMVKGYSKEKALLEAERCLECGICVARCPAHMDIPEYIKAIREDDIELAVKILYETNPFSASCGRICTHSCEEVCALAHNGEPIAIRWLKRYIMDQVTPDQIKEIITNNIQVNNKKIAIIGAGPGGLSAAYYLRLLGYEISVYESKTKGGGMLRYGIPEYRLPYDQLDKDIDYIASLGVQINYGKEIGKDLSFDELYGNFDAIYFSIGLEKPTSLRCVGEDLDSVVAGVDFLRDITDGKRPDIGNDVVVIGGGNVAMDVARTSIRLGANVTVLYRRRIEDMPADLEEITEAQEENVIFNPQSLQTKIEKAKSGRLLLQWNNMKMVEDPEGDRPKPIPIEGDLESKEFDTIFSAIGQKADLSFISEKYEEKMKFKWGKAVTNQFGQTDIPKVFAGGDVKNWTADAVSAIADGHSAAKGIDEFLQKR